MRLLQYIMGKSVLFEVRVSNEPIDIKLWVVHNSSKGVRLEQKELDTNKSLEKWKHSMAILSVSGEQIVSKIYPKNDAAIKKITENKDLLCNITPSGEDDECLVSFLRRDGINEFIELLDKNNIHILDIWITRNELSTRKKQLNDFYRKEMTLSSIRKTPGRLNIFCDSIYYKLRLPVLLILFCVLLANFFFNTQLRNEYEIIQTELNMKQRNDKTFRENQKKQNRLQTEYQKIPDCSFALIADRIASYVPTSVQLNLLSVFPLESARSLAGSREKGLKLKTGSIIVKGEVEIPGSVTLFTQFLGNDNLFSKVEILSLSKQKDSSLFNFELQITL